METTISATELARGLSEILARVRFRGERFIVERNGKPIAAIGPPGAPPGVTWKDVAMRIGDLYVPSDGFADDLEDIQQSQPRAIDPVWPL